MGLNFYFSINRSKLISYLKSVFLVSSLIYQKKLLHTISLPIIFSVSMKKKRKSLWNYNFYINELWSFCKIWLSVGNHKNSIFLFIWLKSYLTIIKTSNHRNTIIDSQLGLTLNVILISGLKRNKFIFLYVGNRRSVTKFIFIQLLLQFLQNDFCTQKSFKPHINMTRNVLTHWNCNNCALFTFRNCFEKVAIKMVQHPVSQ